MAGLSNLPFVSSGSLRDDYSFGTFFSSRGVLFFCSLCQAAEFAKSFYASLLRGDTVRQAFQLGSAKLGVSDQPEEGHKFL